MARGAILEEHRRSMDPHEGQEVVRKDLFVPLPVDRTVFWQEVKASLPSLPTKATPDHHTCGVLDGLQDYLVLVSAHGLVAPHCGGPGMDQAERRLITVHDILPLRGIPVLVFSGKCQPLLAHGGCQQRLLGGPMGGQAQLLLQAILDGVDRNITPPCDLIFLLAS
jgi:hypothetical protein